MTAIAESSAADDHLGRVILVTLARDDEILLRFRAAFARALDAPGRPGVYDVGVARTIPAGPTWSASPSPRPPG